MMRTVIAGLLVTMMNGQAIAAGIDGNFLEPQCKAEAATASAYILGVVEGYSVAIENHKIRSIVFCAPKETHGSQLVDVVCNYIRDHPEKRHLHAARLSFIAFAEAWPCE